MYKRQGIGSALWFKLNKSNTCGVSPYISLNYAYATNGPLSDTTTSTSTAITLEQALSTLGLTITDLLNKGTDDQLSIIYYLVNQYPNFTQEMIYQTLYPNPPTVTTVSTNLIPISHNKSVGIGVEIGSTFQFSSMVHLNISTSWINQTAVTMTLQINL